MVFDSLKKMMGKKKEPESYEEPPIPPVLAQRQFPPRDNFAIPSVGDIPPAPTVPEIPEPPSFPPLPEATGPMPPAIEERRRQRIETFRRARGYETSEQQWPPQPEQPQWPQTQQQAWAAAPSSNVIPQPAPAVEPPRQPRSGENFATVLDHLDRIEQRLMDIDRRLALIESAARMR